MTTGKRALGHSSNPFGQEMASAGPKQLFQDLMSSKSPIKALGDRNAAKTPGPSKSGPSKGKGAPGSNLDNSPLKKGSSELSPRKASTSNALRSINGKQRQTTDLPFTKPGQNSTKDGMPNMMKTPAPAQLSNRSGTMSRQNSFVTPAANTGRAGQIKARMGEILDAEMGLSLQKTDNATEQVTEEPVVQLTEEEMYPEIEYMPSSSHAKHPVFEFPDELDDLPRAKELGARLSQFSTLDLGAAGPGDVSDTDIIPMELLDDDRLEPSVFMADSDDDDPWPDVPVTNNAPAVQAQAPVQSTTSTVAHKPIARPALTARPKSSTVVTTVRPAASSSARRPLVTPSTKAPVTSTTSNGRVTAARAPGQPAARPAGMQRSIASAPGSRAPPVSSATNRATTAVKSSATAGRTASRPIAPIKSTTTRTPLASSKPNEQPAVPRPAAMQINPKLIDFVDDDLGKQTAATLLRMDAEEDVEALQLDLGEESVEEP